MSSKGGQIGTKDLNEIVIAKVAVSLVMEKLTSLLSKYVEFLRVPKTDIVAISHPVNMLPELLPMNNPPTLSTTDTKLSLSLPTKSNSIVGPPVSHFKVANPSYVGMPFGNSLLGPSG
ncbi:hypothetical protein GOBAR_AA32480 [Gossypium barbadense]|uniref:Uncharacterized protein n=1 Tax=Gossypium barbadense TaxID=3634 RepID=A0A2P5WAT6_GOSBA|nr:hypothetical protein GOBAR_AA32480 [Gossypium barbadense]